jgi:uncharacterized protein (TIGR00369 family)
LNSIMKETIHNHLLADTYPPQDHMLRDLSIDMLTTGTESATIQAPVVPEICSEKGVLCVGLQATLVDVLGGVIAIPAFSPDWISTSNLSIHTTRPVMSGRVWAEGRVLRAGRTSVVIGVEIQAGETALLQQMAPAGFATITYSRLPGNKTKLQMKTSGNPQETVRFSLKGVGLDKPFVQKLGVQILDRAAGKIVLNMKDYVRNSLGSLQGGMTAFLADLAGQYIAREATGKPGQTRDLVVNYMSPGITGPFQTAAEVLRMDHHSVLTRVRVIDQGNEHRLVAVVLNSVRLSDE